MSNPIFLGKGSEVRAQGHLQLVYGVDVPLGASGVVKAYSRSEYRYEKDGGTHYYLVKFNEMDRLLEVEEFDLWWPEKAQQYYG